MIFPKLFLEDSMISTHAAMWHKRSISRYGNFLNLFIGKLKIVYVSTSEALEFYLCFQFRSLQYRIKGIFSTKFQPNTTADRPEYYRKFVLLKEVFNDVSIGPGYLERQDGWSGRSFFAHFGH